jgi:hypothetical protein
MTDELAGVRIVPIVDDRFRDVDAMIAMMQEIKLKQLQRSPASFYLVATHDTLPPPKWNPPPPSILNQFDDWWGAMLKRRGLERFIKPRIELNARCDFSSRIQERALWIRRQA